MRASAERSLLQVAGLPYFVVAFIARLPFAMMVVGVLTIVVAVRGSLALGGVTSAMVGAGTACFGALIGAAADRFGQRPVLLVIAFANSMLLVLFSIATYSAVSDVIVLLAAFGIGATAPQVAPMSRSRLVMIIRHRMPAHRHPRTISSTMAYESAADELVFVIGPFLVGLLASFISPWAPLVGAAALMLLFVGAFALHPSGRHTSHERDEHGNAPSRVADLFRPQLLTVVFGILGIGLFFGTMLTALTAFMAERGLEAQAGLLYGVMGIGSGAFALGVAWLPPRFSLRARWLVFAAVMLLGTAGLLLVTDVAGMTLVLGIIGIGIGPTLVTQYSLGAAHSPLGRSATVMTMLGSAVIVGQSIGAAITGPVAQGFGASAALTLPVVAAAIVVAAGVVNFALTRVHTTGGVPR